MPHHVLYQFDLIHTMSNIFRFMSMSDLRHIMSDLIHTMSNVCHFMIMSDLCHIMSDLIHTSCLMSATS